MANDLTLYALTDEYRQLLELAADPEADAESFDAALAAMQGELTDRALAVAAVARNLEAAADAIADAVKEMTMREKRLERRAARIREYLLSGMTAAGVTRVESPHFTVAVRDNPIRVVVADDADVPPDLCRVIPARTEPDKLAIRQALESGETVDGCRLEKSKRVEIK